MLAASLALSSMRESCLNEVRRMREQGMDILCLPNLCTHTHTHTYANKYKDKIEGSIYLKAKEKSNPGRDMR